MKDQIEVLAAQKELAKAMFESYPSVDVFFVTTDNQFFLSEYRTHAEAHQRIKDEKMPVKTITRTMAMQEAPWMPEGYVAEPPVAEDAPTEASTKDQIITWLKGKGVEAETKEKKDDLLAKVKQYRIQTTSSLEITEVPSDESTVQEIMDWLKAKNVDFEESETKVELLAKIANFLKDRITN